MEIYHQYVKIRRQFGRWPRVVDEHAEMIADVRPNEEHAAAYVERSPVTTCAQVIPDMSEHEANTNEVLYSKHNINHEEGGWPKDVDYTEAEHTIRFRKKVEKDEDYIKTVVRLGTRTETRVMQNNAIDIYRQYFTSDSTDIVAEVCFKPVWWVLGPLSVPPGLTPGLSKGRLDEPHRLLSAATTCQHCDDAVRSDAHHTICEHGGLEWGGHEDCHCVCHHGFPAAARKHEPGLVRVGSCQPQHPRVLYATAQSGCQCQVQPEGPQHHRGWSVQWAVRCL